MSKLRKPNFAEVFSIAFGGYMWFTLTIDSDWLYRNMESNPDSMYWAYMELVGSQFNLAMFSLAVALITIGMLFVRSYTLRIIANVIGLIYFTILAASYVFSYPNIGLGMSAIIVVMLISNINSLIDEQQEEKKHKIICDSYIEEEDENDGAGTTHSERKED